MRSPLLLAILTTIGCEYQETEMCLVVSEETEVCPAADEVELDQLTHPAECDLEATRVLGEGELDYPFQIQDTPGCCYPVKAVDRSPNSECMVGRPYLESGSAVTAPADRVEDPLARAWLAMAAMEHASVAAFARLTLDLMALGAPLELLAEVQRAASDEVVHARLCYQLASRFEGRALAPGAFPFAAPVSPRSDLAAVAADAAREGCVGETVGAWLAAESARRASDPQAVAALKRIAEDEARHAALSWKIVAWALRTGGPAVRQAVAGAFRAPLTVNSPLDSAILDAGRTGLLDPDETLRLARQAVDEVVQPALASLLGRRAPAPQSRTRASS